MAFVAGGLAEKKVYLMSKKQPISQLTIRGFKSIQDMDELELGPLNVLIGANGAGKTSFISYFRMLGELVESRLQVWLAQQGSADRVVSFGIKETSSIRSFVKFGMNGYQFSLTPTVDGGLAFEEENVFFDGLYGKKWIRLGSGQTESRLGIVYNEKKYTGTQGDMVSYSFESISSWKIFHFHDTSDTAGVKRYGSLHDNTFLRPDASNLAAFLYKLSKEFPEVYGSIRRTIQLAVPFFEDFQLTPRTLKTEEEQINLRWRQKDSNYELWPSQLSDGSLRFICLAVALLQPEPPSTIIIDEPELGLHPYAITLLGGLLRSASQRMQVIVSTQSVALVNEFSISDLVVVERKKGASLFTRLDESEFSSWLQEYSVGEIWEKNILGGRPHND